MMKREKRLEFKFTIVLGLALLGVAGSQSWASMYVEGTPLPPSDYGIYGTAWDPGANTASFRPPPVGPGGATFSLMGAGFTDASGWDPGHSGSTVDITTLGIPGYTAANYAADINSALNVWASPSLFTNLGQVADGGVNAGASQVTGGHLGDIRVGAWGITSAGVLAHAFYPATEAIWGLGGTIGGDVHFDTGWTWADDPTDTTADADFDFYTVALHELGHALGLGHSTVAGSVMYPYYGGARRTITADDIAGIQAIYTPVPGAVLLGMLGLSVVGVKLRKHA